MGQLARVGELSHKCRQLYEEGKTLARDVMEKQYQAKKKRGLRQM